MTDPRTLARTDRLLARVQRFGDERPSLDPPSGPGSTGRDRPWAGGPRTTVHEFVGDTVTFHGADRGRSR
jgi:hypothetical protein